jgi:hypothetical protein
MNIHIFVIDHVRHHDCGNDGGRTVIAAVITTVITTVITADASAVITADASAVMTGRPPSRPR